MNFEDLNNTYTNLFDINFSKFKGLKETEYELLKETFIKINKNTLIFDLIEIDKKIQPLEILIKLTSNKIIGELTIDLHNADGLVLGKILINKILLTKIDGLIDFSFSNEKENKTITVSYECEIVTYIGKNGKEEKIS